jgi:hypothetical protein
MCRAVCSTGTGGRACGELVGVSAGMLDGLRARRAESLCCRLGSNWRKQGADLADALREQLNERPHARPVVRAFVAAGSQASDGTTRVCPARSLRSRHRGLLQGQVVLLSTPGTTAGACGAFVRDFRAWWATAGVAMVSALNPSSSTQANGMRDHPPCFQ